ncbi:flagellar hook-length control protein [Hyphomonas polymorpha PS728]|uniref:Flagellar hook-length control protein n=2 Tax=Hyphomonas polymorpha TaxID=74319 RepID=A0A062VHW1_9PROT|nr:flagellar hook-length control protein [Hyphomonas polymorpha PS728]
MTFSVDPDFWLFQPGSRQDAMARSETGEGRGKEFASSLFAVSLPPALSADLAAGDSETLIPAALSLEQAPPPGKAPAIGQAAPSLPAEDLEMLAPNISEPDLEAGTVVSAPAAIPAAQEQADQEIPPAQPPAEALPASSEVSERAGGADPPEPSGKTLTTGETDPAETPTEDIAESAPAQEIAEAPAPPPEVAAAMMAASAPLPAQALPSKIRIEEAAPIPPSLPAREKTPAESAAPTAPRSRSALPASAEAGIQAELTPDAPAADASGSMAPTMGTITAQAGTGSDLNADTAAPQSQQISLFSGAAGQAPSISPVTSALATAQMMPTHAVLTATATQLPDIVARATSDGQDDRVVVQLDPPELGRISIDFKFDAQGLQHVTITAESLEAMRQLRLMHFELVQALERNGLSGQNMSFQHQNPQQNEGWGQQAKLAGGRFDTPALTNSGLMIAADSSTHRQIASSGRLDIRL